MTLGTSKPRRGAASARGSGTGFHRVGRGGRHPNLLVSIHVLSSLIGRAFYGDLDDRFGIGVAEWRVLLTLADLGEATSVEIASAWAMEKMAISRAVRWLEEHGYVRRRADPRDKRRQVLKLARSGRRFHGRILPVANARYREITGSLDHDEVAALRRFLERLIDRTARLARRKAGR
jgi:DNA-binding MarR family transcriptional regulator